MKSTKKGAQGMLTEDGFIQIGFTGQRDPMTGEFGPAIPLYIKSDKVAEEQMESLYEDFGKLIAHRIKEEMDRRMKDEEAAG